MRVRIYDCPGDGTEQLRCESDLSEAFDPADEEYYRAQVELKRSGRIWIGGGAAPLILLTLISA